MSENFDGRALPLASGKLLKFPQMWISNRGGNMNLTKSKLQFGVAPKEEQLGKDDEYQESIHPISEKLCGLSFLFQNILCSMAENLIFWRSLDSTDHGFQLFGCIQGRWKKSLDKRSLHFTRKYWKLWHCRGQFRCKSLICMECNGSGNLLYQM